MWDWVIRVKRVANLLPVLETILAGFHLRVENDSLKNLENMVGPGQARNY
jgi:hypothetical protein